MSAATVSHVLNATRLVSDETRARVLTAVQELGFIPSAAARSRRSRRTRTLALVVSDIENPFFAEVARAVERCAAETGAHTGGRRGNRTRMFRRDGTTVSRYKCS